MTLLGLSWVQFVVALLLPALLAVILYTARLRRKPATVAFAPLWRKVAERVSQTRRLGNVENPLGLMLQIGAILLIAFGAAQPRWPFQTHDAHAVVFVIDNSASLGARSGLRTRFYEARSKALAELERLSDADSVAVVTTGGEVRLQRSFTTLKKSVRETLEAIDVIDGPGQLAAGVRYAAELLRSQSKIRKVKPRIFVVTDGQERLPGLAELGARLPVHVERVGGDKPLPNVAITAFEVRDMSGAPGRYEAFVEVRNLSRKPAKGNLRLSFDSKLLEVRPFQLQPDERFAQSYSDLTGPETGIVTAELTQLELEEGKDALETDNRAWSTLRRAGVSVRLVTRGNLYLTEVLRAQSRYRTTVLKPEEFAAMAARTTSLPGVTIIDGPMPPKLPAGSYLLFNPVPPTRGAAPFTRTGELRNPVFTEHRQDHPVLRGALLADVAIARSGSYKPGAGATVLARSLDDPLIWVQETPGRRMVVVGFDPAESNLVLRVAFPVLVYNAVAWLGDAGGPGGGFVPGRRFRVEVSDPTASRAVVRDPAGRDETAAVSSGAISFVGERVGLYRIRGAGDTQVAANLFSAEESRLVTSPVAASFRKHSVGRLNTETWPLFVLLGILLLLLEWQLYHRRITT